MSTPTKDTIYIDIDDEITSIIDKVQASKHKIVALVLPKRAVTLQSIVNMRLLKRTGQEVDKQIVLITSESSLLPLAGIVGLYTAKTLQSKPLIPPTPDTFVANETLVDDGSVPVADKELDIDEEKSVGELSGMSDALGRNSIGAMAVEETIDVDNTVADGAAESVSTGKNDRSSKIKIPNFERFRLKVILAVVALIVLIVGGIFALKVLPKASITVKTDTTRITSNISFSAQTTIPAVDATQSLVPAQSKELKKSDSIKVAATGKKNVGEKAKGTMTVTNCINDGQSHVVPAGTTFSSGSIAFVTDTDLSLDPALYSGSTCKSATFGLSKNVNVTASNSGDEYNLSTRSYGSSIAGISGSGSAMAGGTTKNITVVSQQDIDGAKGQLVDKSKDVAVAELTKTITAAQLIPLTETISGADPVVSSTPNVGDEAGDLTVISAITYNMLGIKSSDIEKLITLDAKKQIDITKQPIVDFGLLKATFKLSSKRSGLDQSLALQTVSTAGTKIDPDSLKKEIAGKKKADVVSTIEKHPGVKDVTVTYSPFWVSSIPSNLNKTTLVFEQTNGK
jgi:hypothetical protein